MADRISDPLLIRVFNAARGKCLGRGDLATGTAHVLLALLEITPAAELAARGVDRVAVEDRVEEVLVPYHGAGKVVMGPVGCWTPRAKLILSAAAERAATAGRVVELDDVWAGLLRDPDSEVSRVLAECAER